jgi:hypothetical protein
MALTPYATANRFVCPAEENFTLTSFMSEEFPLKILMPRLILEILKRGHQRPFLQMYVPAIDEMGVDVIFAGKCKSSDFFLSCFEAFTVSRQVPSFM